MAAVLAVVAVTIVGFAVTRSGSHHDARRSSLPRIVRAAYLGDVGDLTDPRALRALLDRPSLDESARTSATVDGASLRGDAARALRCAGAVTSTRADPVVLLATATYHAAGAVLVGVHHGARTVAFVLATRDCSVLVSQSR